MICSTSTPIWEAAKQYYRLGWSILPMLYRSKRPAVQSWAAYQALRANDEQIDEWFSGNAQRGLAVILGPSSGNLAVRDYDNAHGEREYDQWVAMHPALAKELPTAKTPNGYHVYFRNGNLGLNNAYVDHPRGELRIKKCYTVLAPSRHVDGDCYRWIIQPYEGIPSIDPFEEGLAPKGGVGSGGHPKELFQESNESNENLNSFNHPKELVSKSVQRAIEESLPTGPGQRHRQIFELARALKGIPELANADLSSLDAAVREWYSLALPFITTKDFDATLSDFVTCWPLVKCPKGEGVVKAAFAAPAPRPCRAILVHSEVGGSLRRLNSACWHLQKLHGDEPFFLSCIDAGKQLGVSHVRANKLMRTLENYGVLTRVSTGTLKGRKASRYRYVEV